MRQLTDLETRLQGIASVDAGDVATAARADLKLKEELTDRAFLIEVLSRQVRGLAAIETRVKELSGQIAGLAAELEDTRKLPTVKKEPSGKTPAPMKPATTLVGLIDKRWWWLVGILVVLSAAWGVKPLLLDAAQLWALAFP